MTDKKEKKEAKTLGPMRGDTTSGRSLSPNGIRRRLEKQSKPGQHHSGAGKVDGARSGKKRIWYESLPLWGPVHRKNVLTMVSTIYQTDGSD